MPKPKHFQCCRQPRALSARAVCACTAAPTGALLNFAGQELGTGGHGQQCIHLATLTLPREGPICLYRFCILPDRRRRPPGACRRMGHMQLHAPCPRPCLYDQFARHTFEIQLTAGDWQSSTKGPAIKTVLATRSPGVRRSPGGGWAAGRKGGPRLAAALLSSPALPPRPATAPQLTAALARPPCSLRAKP